MNWGLCNPQRHMESRIRPVVFFALVYSRIYENHLPKVGRLFVLRTEELKTTTIQATNRPTIRESRFTQFLPIY